MADTSVLFVLTPPKAEMRRNMTSYRKKETKDAVVLSGHEDAPSTYSLIH